MEKPLISIITPSLNRAEFIEEAIKSVLYQDYPIVEHIIMDGGSTDGTLDNLNSYSHLSIISQPDHGLYDAINTGINLVHGDVIGFLNTDDYYEPNIFGRVIQTFRDNPNIDAVVGSATFFFTQKDGQVETVFSFPAVQPDELWYRLTIGAPIFNAWFFRKKVFHIIGEFNQKYRYAADRDYLIRFALNNCSFFPLDKPAYHYRQHPDSLTIDGAYDGEATHLLDCLEMIDYYLNSGTLPEETRKIFYDWHSYITSGQTISAIRKLKPKRTALYIQNGWSNNYRWPLIFTKRIVSGVNRRIRN